MNDWLANPAVQAGAAPFLVALVVATPLRRGRFLALAIGAAFLTVAALAIGLPIAPLNAVRKLVLVGVGTAVLAVLLERFAVRASVRVRAVLVGAATLAGLWVLLRVLQQQELRVALLPGSAAALYLAVLVDSTNAASADNTVRSASTALVLGLGSGALALLGASALLAQVGIAIGAGAGTTLLVQMIAGERSPVGWTLAMPAAVVAGLVALLSVFTGELGWYFLLPLLAVPWAARLVPAGVRPLWLTALLTALAALLPALLAVALAWAGGQVSPT